MLVDKGAYKPVLSRPKLFDTIIEHEAEKHRVLTEPVINMMAAKTAIRWHRSLLAQAEQYVFGTKDKGKTI